MDSMISPSSSRRATRFMVSSVCSAGDSLPRASKNSESLRRMRSYFSPARSRFGSSAASRSSNAFAVSDHSVFRAAGKLKSIRGYVSNVGFFLLPFTLKFKGGPVERSVPTFLFPHLYFRQAQGRRRSQIVFQHAAIEPLHEFGGGGIIDFPKTRDYSRRTGVHE